MSIPIFALKKAKILSQLAVPETEYSDLSPKGSVDAGIRDLIDEINSLEGVVTTSSCAGRVSVYLEGHKQLQKKASSGGDQKAVVRSQVDDDDDADEIAAERRNPFSSSAAGGKGGGEWLFVSHDPLPSSPPSLVLKDGGAGNAKSWSELFGLAKNSCHKEGGIIDGISGRAHDDETSPPPRLIHFKFEPMILHVLTASHSLAQMIIQAGMEAGFRETGAVSLLPSNPSSTTPTPMVAVRSMGLSFESLIGIQTFEGKRSSLVSAEYLELLVKISHERFAENQKRIARFREALKVVFAAKKNVPEGWEDGEARRERKRLEGLRRREELRQRGQNQPLSSTTDDQEPLDLGLGL
ncbi:tRNA wybutosine-synthesizing protein, partial [Rhypophila decipiens]